MTKSEIAVSKYKKGYNCCQAVACTFAEELGMDESELYRVCEGFGGGMGSGLGVCGAMSGAAVVAGLLNSDGNIEHAGQTKAKSTRAAAQMQMEFVDRAGALACKEIKMGQKTSCAKCIAIATEAVEKMLDKCTN